MNKKETKSDKSLLWFGLDLGQFQTVQFGVCRCYLGPVGGTPCRIYNVPEKSMDEVDSTKE